MNYVGGGQPHLYDKNNCHCKGMTWQPSLKKNY